MEDLLYNQEQQRRIKTLIKEVKRLEHLDEQNKATIEQYQNFLKHLGYKLSTTKPLRLT